MTERKKVSREGVALIKSLEGLRTTAQRAGDGRWVIGYGHTASAREGGRLTGEEAELLLQYDLLPIVAALNQTLTREVNQRQFDALASYGLSLGAARLRSSPAIQAVNEGRLDAAAAAIADDDRTPASAPAAPVAQRRRGAERALFLSDPARPVTVGDLLAAPLPFADATAVAPVDEPVVVEVAETAEVAAFPAVETADVEPIGDDNPASADEGDIASEIAPEPEPEVDVASDGGVLRNTRADAVAALLADAPLAVAEAKASERLVLTEVANDAVSAPAPEEPTAPETFERGDQTLAADQTATASPSPEPSRAGQGNSFARSAEEDALTSSRPRPGIVRHAGEDRETPRTRAVETLAFLGLGALGFITFGAALGAFRLAADRAAEGDQTRLIAWTLTLIAAVCVGVAAHQLHKRYGAEAVLPQDDKAD